MANSVFELLEIDDSLPFDVSLHSVNYVPSHWHNSVEIIFVLRGTLEVSIDTVSHTLKEGDVLLINQHHVHEVIGLDMNIIATYQIPTAYLKEHIAGFEGFSFAFQASKAGPESRDAVSRLRRLLAEMVQLKYKQTETYELEMQAAMLGVLSILVKQFKVPLSEGGISERYMDRMLRIITYIDNHYREPITLQSIADREFLSVPYLSKFFSENIGLNFQAYLTSIRLKNAVEDLLRQEEIPIADLAMFHGFPNAKSFYSAFKNRYHVTPNEYRKQYRPEPGKKKEKSTSNYMEFNQSSALGIINQYLERGGSPGDREVHSLETLTRQVDAAVRTQAISHTWKNLITIGKAKEGLHADVQRQLRYVQERCPFRFLRFHGIFDDGMMVYNEREDGQPVYNFRLVDQLFDFLLSIHLKPFVELGFMPSALAADPEKGLYFRRSYTSPPKSLDTWCELIDRFIRHCMNRYGPAEVESWMFEFWNEPELEVYWPGTDEEYFELYSRTFHTMKNISRKLRIGAPGRIITLRSNLFSERFFAFCRERECLPDFIPCHFYPHENLEGFFEPDEEQSELRKLEPYRILLEEFRGISPNPDYLRDMLTREKQLLEKEGLSDREIYLTEFNSTAFHRELTNDTLYKAAYIAKNLIDNLDRIQGFGYWVLSDNIEETSASPALFHGGLGLIAQYGIPKPAMYAYELLAKLGDQLIERGEGYIVTKSANAYQILCYNYCHFDDLYALGDTSFVTPTSRYSGFKNERTVKLEFQLDGIDSGRYKIVRRSLNRSSGSSFDVWVEMGAPSIMTGEDLHYIKQRSEPGRHITHVDVENRHMTCTFTLEPHAVELVELIPVI
ncbi:GH39 family glycosyl hydrolase [Paenibacillus sp. VMFN-D1]|uniref:GH39 family glycosyl hydrolase n=1 Tax=Paenibacillus sp. VMFN-D1 TaxID=2135608 RepID=UPI000E2877FE|nr:helix-turn-helix domain-containing protein [Paenibacillus sp. VMFN-D1]RED40995.1 xylan 1,4-beta-xylosidase [Paenibacillus sp. VMFN-D1]